MLRAHHLSNPRSNVRAQPFHREELFRLEPLEPRLFLTIAASLSGAIKAETGHTYSAYIQTTGTQTASSETFHFDDPDAPSDFTVNNPTNPQVADHIYPRLNVDTGRRVNADVTPAGGGSTFNIPLTLNSAFGGLGTSTFTGKLVTPPAGATTGSANVLGISASGDIFVAGPCVLPGGSQVFAVTKFDSQGALVTTFGNGGTALIDFPGSSPDVATDMEMIEGGF